MLWPNWASWPRRRKPISSSCRTSAPRFPQLKAAIKELQSQGYKLPEYPENPKDDKEKDIKARYDKVKGSAVNPVLREGNSDRRAPLSVKAHTRKHPHKMGAWSPDSKTHVAHMKGGDFRSNEKSMTMTAATDARIEFVGQDGKTTVLKPKVALQAGEVIDATFMSKRALAHSSSKSRSRTPRSRASCSRST